MRHYEILIFFIITKTYIYAINYSQLMHWCIIIYPIFTYANIIVISDCILL